MSEGWHTIDTAPGVGIVVDLWRNGERLTDFYQDLRGNWCRDEGYPVTRRVLTSPPTHWRYLPGPPATPPEEGAGR